MASETMTLIFVTVISSSGIWSILVLILKRRWETKDAYVEGLQHIKDLKSKFETFGDTFKHSEDLLLGVAHATIIREASIYLLRGWISPNEYQIFAHSLYKPYKEMGGNGLADKFMEEISHLPNHHAERNEELREKAEILKAARKGL